MNLHTISSRPLVSGKKRVLRFPGGKTNQTLNIATWNVRSMREFGKLHRANTEMPRLNIDILGVSETWWTNSGMHYLNNSVFYYSGNDDEQNNYRQGVGVLIPKTDQIQYCLLFGDPREYYT